MSPALNILKHVPGCPLLSKLVHKSLCAWVPARLSGLSSHYLFTPGPCSHTIFLFLQIHHRFPGLSAFAQVVSFTWNANPFLSTSLLEYSFSKTQLKGLLLLNTSKSYLGRVSTAFLWGSHGTLNIAFIIFVGNCPCTQCPHETKRITREGTELIHLSAPGAFLTKCLS